MNNKYNLSIVDGNYSTLVLMLSFNIRSDPKLFFCLIVCKYRLKFLNDHTVYKCLKAERDS